MSIIVVSLSPSMFAVKSGMVCCSFIQLLSMQLRLLDNLFFVLKVVELELLYTKSSEYSFLLIFKKLTVSVSGNDMLCSTKVYQFVVLFFLLLISRVELVVKRRLLVNMKPPWLGTAIITVIISEPM